MAAEGGARGFAVGFKDLVRWDVAGFSDEGWHWPTETLLPMGTVVRRAVTEVNPKTPKAELPIIGKITFGGELFLSEADDRDGYKGRLFWANAGQLVYSKIRVKQGSFCVVPETFPSVAVSAEYPVYDIAAEKALPTFIDLLLRCDYMKSVLDGLAHGGGTKTRIHPEQFEALTIPVPSMEIQTSIVTHWQALQAQAKQAQTLADQCEAKGLEAFLCALGLETASAGVKRKGFALPWSRIGRWGVELNQPGDQLDVTAGHYPVVALSDVIADLANGWSPKCLDRPIQANEWGVLKLGAVSFGAFNAQENKALPPSLQPVPALEIRPGDWLISRANITRLVGACALVQKTPPRLLLCDKIFRAVWRADAPVLPAYLDEVLKTAHLRQQIERALTGTSPTMKNISKPSLLALRLPLPPLPVQASLVGAIQSARAEAARLRAHAVQLRQQARQDIEAALLGQSLAGSGGAMEI